ncbi:MAG: RdgB/HAM1 family non-canonical purine NTP pyrophosphatase [Candidatus Thorarchaeota archaeon]
MSKDSVVLVTQNKHKLKELTPLFKEFQVTFETASLEKYEIRADDVADVALEAAKRAHRELDKPVVVDDTGLYIESLAGFPKAYPAFVLETIGTGGILKLMEAALDRTARFVIAAGYADAEQSQTFLGEMHGTIAMAHAGTGGFGYDPIFIPEGYSKTYAELSFEEKIAISHRTKAFRAFLEWYTKA